LNNYSCVLSRSDGSNPEIKKCLDLATHLVKHNIVEMPTVKRKALLLIIAYNIGYYYEHAGKMAEAIKYYK